MDVRHGGKNGEWLQRTGGGELEGVALPLIGCGMGGIVAWSLFGSKFRSLYGLGML